MPAQFDSMGLRFLYPDNWTVAPSEETEASSGMGATLDIPGGGFLSLEWSPAADVDEMISRIETTICEEYDDVERENTHWDLVSPDTPIIDLRFYYLDLLIQCRFVLLTNLPAADRIAAQQVFSQPTAAEGSDEEEADTPSLAAFTQGDPPVLVVQLQAESRDFDKNETVFAAIIKQLTEQSL